ncbi:SDR family oxidoreductase [Aquamicrobium sp. LC103]|uniref:SDR family oxidoreductase n=1 Tax=Aquamicrobium sp. LC103 TaxID=1120658 RepID=UPI00069C71DD|nr:SDR family oxidoreductase [Aquamicrobium sp. LC103]TKT69506.1 SDR family oxidoreductase [Aquamicrobium sp. LC103]
MSSGNSFQTHDNARRDFLRNSLIVGTVVSSSGMANTSAEGREATTNGVLAGRVALVTGAARGIGRAISEAYVREGAAVAMVDLADPDAVPPVDGYRTANMQEFDEAVAAAVRFGGRVLKIQADVRIPDEMGTAVERAMSEFGGLDIVVANAGCVRWHSFAEGTELDWKSVFDVNVHGVFNSFKAAIPALRQRGTGRLIAISSIGGRQGVPGNGAYTSTKWAVIGLTKQAALELGPDNITVNSIAPGPTDTPMYRSQGQIRSMGVTTSEDQDRIIGPMLPLGDLSVLEPKAIADAAVFLASEAASSISGISLDVARGYNASYTA